MNTEYQFLQQPDLLCGTDPAATLQVVEGAILDLWGVVNKLTSIQPPKHERYRVTIFGSARLQPDDPLYIEVRQLAHELTKLGCDIVTGGGPGLMQAANEGSVMANSHNQTQSIGIRIDLSFEQEANPYVEKVYQHGTFFTRLHHFAMVSDAFVVVPGGIGTTLEAVMVWQLLQVHALSNTPLIMVGPMWQDFVRWAEQHMTVTDPPLAHPSDMLIPRCVDTFAEAIILLQQSHAQWQNAHCNLDV
jgi:uncharacterized protein (TIGR00730 family)